MELTSLAAVGTRGVNKWNYSTKSVRSFVRELTSCMLHEYTWPLDRLLQTIDESRKNTKFQLLQFFLSLYDASMRNAFTNLKR